MYTEADFIFYYFIDSKELNIIPMVNARPWFLNHKERFQTKTLYTKAKDRILYETEGKLVPKNTLNKEVKGVRTFSKIA